MRKIFLVLLLLLVLGFAGFYLYLQPRYTVPILMYHRINDQGEYASLNVSPENFYRQMQFLAKANYNVISLSEFVAAKEKDLPLARNTVVITFDDGFEDNYLAAYPVLQEFNVPATIFLIVDYIGEEDYLTYEQINEMLASGTIDFGSHSLAGDYLPKKTILRLAREIGTSKRELEAQLKTDIEFICYPLGGFNAKIQELVKKYGYRAACTTNRGNRQTYLNDDIFALKRVKVRDPNNLFVFWVKISGYYDMFRKVENPY